MNARIDHYTFIDGHNRALHFQIGKLKQRMSYLIFLFGSYESYMLFRYFN